MTSSLLLAYPDVAATALEITSSLTQDDDHSAESLRSGQRSAHFRTSGYGTSLNLDFDAGSAVENSLNYLIVARADLLQTYSVTSLTLLQDDNSAFSSPTSVHQNATFNSATLYGPNLQDYVTTFSASTEARYTRVTLGASAGSNFRCGKIYTGTLLDLGKDPDGYEYDIVDGGASEVSFSTGRVLLTRSKDPRYAFMVRWKNVSDSNALLFLTKILQDPAQHLVYLYAGHADGNSEILAGNTLVHCKVLSSQCVIQRETVDDKNVITAYFEEVKG